MGCLGSLRRLTTTLSSSCKYFHLVISLSAKRRPSNSVIALRLRGSNTTTLLPPSPSHTGAVAMSTLGLVMRTACPVPVVTVPQSPPRAADNIRFSSASASACARSSTRFFSSSFCCRATAINRSCSSTSSLSARVVSSSTPSTSPLPRTASTLATLATPCATATVATSAATGWPGSLIDSRCRRRSAAACSVASTALACCCSRLSSSTRTA
mmetsp:Transcript_25465/g.60123  ORF Transcript_25465/g.60123 Transcript_25465/m.60123 type:complete len:212 (-) Transcript_25465:439-1074(-)